MEYKDFEKHINSLCNISELNKKHLLHINISKQAGINKILADNEENPWFWGAVCSNLKNEDFSYLDADELSRLPFSTKTIWPKKDKLPKGFNPEDLIKRGLSVKGCGIEECHGRGLTGKGIKIAVIDRAFDTCSHEEFANHHFNEVYMPKTYNELAQFHGYCATARLFGKNLGVAPDAYSIFYGYDKDETASKEKHDEIRLNILYSILEKIRKGEKIRIVSMSSGIYNANEYKNIKLELQNLGCEIISAKEMGENNIYYSYNLNNFEDGNLENQYDFYKSAKCLYIQDGGKCSPLPFTKNDYFFEGGLGCMSYTIPQLAGMYALALQEKESLTFQDFLTLARKTCDKNKSDMHFININKICQKLEQTKIKSNLEKNNID